MATSPPGQYRLEDYGYRFSRIIDHTLDDAQLQQHCPLDNGRHVGEPKQSTGKLDLLPVELITEVLLSLDIPSLTTFRRVNRRSRSLVDSLHKYSMIFESCPDLLRAMISLDARHCNCASLFATLSTTKCASCDRFGPYIYLITCKRVCYFCFTMDIAYFPLSTTLATRYSGIPRKELARLPHILSLPGRFTEPGKLSRGRIMLLDRQSLRENARTTHTQALDDAHRRSDLTTREPRRYMSIISAPYFNSPGQSAEWGFYCTECIDSKVSATHFRTKYTRDGFMSHMILYGPSHHRRL